jgi:hypothetical protein
MSCESAKYRINRYINQKIKVMSTSEIKAGGPQAVAKKGMETLIHFKGL